MNKRVIAVVLAGGLLASAVIAGPATAAKKKKKPKPAVCAPYAPGELGAGQPIVTITDAATAEAPVTQTVSLDQSVADLTFGATDSAAAAFNVQVDSAAPSTGLYAKITFEPRRDFDIFLRYPDGSEGASSHGWNTVYEDPGDAGGETTSLSSTGHGGETTDTSETIHGIATADCGGWTVDVQNHLGMASDITVELWLGEVKNEALAAGEVPAE